MVLLHGAILVISDTASSDPSTDQAIPTLKKVFAQEVSSADGTPKWAEPLTQIVSDDMQQIQNAIRSWTDPDGRSPISKTINLIVTTGGTGFSHRDFTPEAVLPLLHRQAPGILHAMLKASFEVTPFAMMARPVAGVRNKTIIITLPGSPKGAKENLEAVIKLIAHACFLAEGGNSRDAHVGGVKKLENDAGVTPLGKGFAPVIEYQEHPAHSHHHHHDHNYGGHGHQIPKAHTSPSDRPQLQSNDPRLGASQRYRSSPYPMLSVSDAVSVILENTPIPTTETRKLSPELTGYVVAEDIRSKEAVPAYRASLVDGYAVIVPDERTNESSDQSIKGTFPVASVSHAQASSLPPPLQAGQIARITTGAPLPGNANAVIMVEDTTIATLTPDGKEEQTVQILTGELIIGENIREPGSDIQLNDLILPHGTQISALGGEIGVLAASGTPTLSVYKKPRVGVMSTGDEVTDITHPTPLHGGMIRDSNRPSLLTLLRGWHLCSEVLDLHIARDTPHTELESKLREAFQLHDLDIVVTTGGVSMGELDLLKPTVERALGGTVHFGRVSMKPGKPTTFASIPGIKSSATGSRDRKRLIFGLPGNPASALVTANLFLLPCIQKMTGMTEPVGLQRVKVRVAGKIKCDKQRTEYHRVSVAVDKGDGRLVAKSTGMQRSSRVGSLASANALLELPMRDGVVEEGGECEALMMGMVHGF